MATKQVARPFVKHTLAFSSSQHISRPVALRRHFNFSPARRRLSQCRPARPTFIARQRRPFSNTLRTRYASLEDSIDPRDQPRESDEVDVCIVGGGMFTAPRPVLQSRTVADRHVSPAVPVLKILALHRSRRSQRRHSSEATRQRSRQ
jgi:hypothetical protein